MPIPNTLHLLALAAFLLYVPPAASYLCVGGVGDACELPDGTSFCTVHYTACLRTATWKEQDSNVEHEFQQLQARYPVLSNASMACLDGVRDYRCAVAFSECSGTEGRAKLLCDTECGLVASACEADGIGEDALDAVCALDPLGLAGEDECQLLGTRSTSYFLWGIGVTLAILCSLFNSVAINIQKLSLNRNPDKSVLRQPLWMLGFALLLTGTFLDFIAFGLAPQSLLAPLAALTLVWNMLMIPLLLKERLDWYNVISTVVIFSGATLTVVFANHTTPHYTLGNLRQFYHNVPMQWYAFLVPIAIALHMAAVGSVDRLRLEGRIGNSAVRQALIQRVHLLGCAGGSGMVGGQSVLFAKSVVELLKSALVGGDQVARQIFSSPEVFLLISALVTCMLLQISYLNRGLAHHDALSVVPTYQAYWIVSSVLGGFVYFDEVRMLSQLALSMFFLGIMITIVGVLMLARRKESHSRASPMPKEAKKRSGKHSEWSKLDDTDAGETRLGGDDENAEPAARRRSPLHWLRRNPNSFAVDAYLEATPRLAAAGILVEMGIEPEKVGKLLGNGNAGGTPTTGDTADDGALHPPTLKSIDLPAVRTESPISSQYPPAFDMNPFDEDDVDHNAGELQGGGRGDVALM